MTAHGDEQHISQLTLLDTSGILKILFFIKPATALYARIDFQMTTAHFIPFLSTAKNMYVGLYLILF